MSSTEHKLGYYYLHTNGSLIWKNSVVVDADPEYFNSDFVVKVWEVKDQEDHSRMMADLINDGPPWGPENKNEQSDTYDHIIYTSRDALRVTSQRRRTP